MPRAVKDRIAKLRREIAEIREASSLYVQRGKKQWETADHERRLQRLQEIMDELKALTAIGNRYEHPQGSCQVCHTDDLLFFPRCFYKRIQPILP